MEATYSEQILEARDENRFSWRRVWMLFQLYYPLLKKQIIFFPILSALAVLLTAWLMKVNEVASMFDEGFGFAGWPMYMISIMFYLAPIGLARRDMRSLCAMLPVKPLEKLVFLILYLWGGVMVLTTGVAYLTVFALIPFNPNLWNLIKEVYTQFHSMFGISALSFWGWVMAWLYQSIVLFVVITVKRNRVLWGIISYFAISVCFGILSGIAGAIWVIYMVTQKGKDYILKLGEDLEAGNVDNSLSPEMAHLMDMVMTPLGIVSTIVLAWIMWGIYKKLKYSGI
ncbi:MAG: hypothetical protein LIP09_12500 [Bacteroidales bacterium]|nr:hypothetical protein [Bacteroidales bacterium]